MAAMKFLIRYENELDRLPKVGVDTMHFDFGYAPPDQMRSEVYVPVDLIRAMAGFNMGLVFTVIRSHGVKGSPVTFLLHELQHEPNRFHFRLVNNTSRNLVRPTPKKV